MKRPSQSVSVVRRPNALPLLDVRRLGWGYWIGAIASTLLYVTFTLPDPEELGGPAFCLFVGRLAAVLMMLVGAACSFADFLHGVGEGDLHRTAGGMIGFAFSVWPIGWVFIAG